MRLRKYHCIKQHDITDCGAACLATIIKQHGQRVPVTKIRQIAGTDKQGTNALGIITAAKKLGFGAKGVKAEKEHLVDELPLPCIAHVLIEDLQHYVVIHRISKGKVLIADPAKGLVTYTVNEFCAIWTGVLLLMVPTEQFESQEIDTKTEGLFWRFWKLLLPQRGLMCQIFLASVIYTLFGLVGAFYFKTLIDNIFVDGALQTLHVVSIGFILLNVFRQLLDAFRNQLLLYLSQRIDIALMLNYYQHVLSLPMDFFDSRRVGEILSRVSDASKIRIALSGATLSVVLDTLMIVVSGLVLFFQNRFMFGVALVFIPFYLLVFLLFNKPYQRVQRQTMEDAADLESYMVESLNGAATIKAFAGETQVLATTETKFIKLLRSVFSDSSLRNTQRVLQNSVTVVSDIVMTWVGGYQIIQGLMSVGQLITYNALLGYFFRPIANLAGLQPAIQEAYIAAERLGEILDLEPEQQDSDYKVKPKSLSGDIILNNVSFGYGTRGLVLKDINLQIAAGEKVALVGESGSGKSTLAKLLLNFYQPTTGEILIDTYNILDIDITSLRTQIGYVPQDIFLFNGSILENITFGIPDVTGEQIMQLSERLDLLDFFNQLPLRWQTRVGEWGSSLSGGQKQRLAILRVLLKQPDILVLDEATSSLDSRTEKTMHTAIDELSEGLTSVIIAHRLSTIMRCDRIVVLSQGKIVEIGSHAELLTARGEYYRLWKAQVSGEVDYEQESVSAS